MLVINCKWLVLLKLVTFGVYSNQQCQSTTTVNSPQRGFNVYKTDKVARSLHRENTPQYNTVDKFQDVNQPHVNGLFISPNCTEVLTQLGTTAILHCEVSDIGESAITWIRRKDYQLLTVGLNTYSSDERFFSTLGKNMQDWVLHIRFTTEDDEGFYECQIPTHPPASLFVKLKLVEAHADVVGGSDKIVKSGSLLRLICIVRRSTEPPIYLFWYHGSRMINFDLNGGATIRHGKQSSELVIPHAEKHHAGNYTCVPSNARSASVLVHVLENETPAAMQHDSSKNAAQPAKFSLSPYWVLALVCHLLMFFFSNKSHTTERNVR